MKNRILYECCEDKVLTAKEKLEILSEERKRVLKTIAEELQQTIEEITDDMKIPLKIYIDYGTYIVKNFDIEVTDDGALELSCFEFLEDD